MEHLLFKMVLGHFIGDYLLQNDWMASNKQKHLGLGYLTCIVHCLVYSLAVCICMQKFDIWWIVTVFLSHFFIDKYAIAEKWLRLLKGRSIGLFLEDRVNQEYSAYIGLRAGLTTFVYIVADNTMHMIILFYSLIYFF